MPRGRKPRKKAANPVGRPTDYRPEMCADVQQWVQEGIVDHEIAARLGIARSTLYDWKNEYSDFADAFERGNNHRHQNVINSLYKRCMGYEYTETTKEPQEAKSDDPSKPGKIKMVITKKVKKQVAPDTGAIEFYLTNKLPDEFKNKSEVNNNISGSLGLRSDGMTEEDKLALIKKQAEKAKALEG